MNNGIVSILLAAVLALSIGLVSCGGEEVPEIAEYNLTISSTEGGSVTTPGEGTFTYHEGTVVDLVAESEEGYSFVNWTGDVSTIGNVNAAITIVITNGDYEITANFAIEILEIRDWYDLDAIRNKLGSSYILMNNLDTTSAGYEELASPTANDGKGWEPLGTSDDEFTGTFDGREHEIRDLFINRPDEDYVGLFGKVGWEGVIKNVGVVNVTVTGHWQVGGVVGTNQDNVTNCYSTGSVTGHWQVGGLVGTNFGTVSNSYSNAGVSGDDIVGGLVGGNGATVSNSHSTGSVIGILSVGGLVGTNHDGGTVSNSHSSANVTGEDAVGGLVGHNMGAVGNSYSTGSVTGDWSVGGLVGVNVEGTVSHSYSDASVTGNDLVGGLAGHQNTGTVSDCYATGSVTGSTSVGGLVGWNYYSSVSNSFSTASVTGSTSVGGLVGLNHQFESYVSDSFWDTETGGQSTSDGGTGKTTAEMQDITTFSGATWDIVAVASPGTRNTSYIWNIVDGQTYPFLSWQSI